MNRKNKLNAMVICCTTIMIVGMTIYTVLLLGAQSARAGEKDETLLESSQEQKVENSNRYVDLLKENPEATVENKLNILLEYSFSNILEIYKEGYTNERTATLQLQPLFWIRQQLQDKQIDSLDAYQLLLMFHSEEDGEEGEFKEIINNEAQIYLPKLEDEDAMNRFNEILSRLSSFLDNQSEKIEQVVTKPLALFLL